MKIGYIGLGKMGQNMVLRLLEQGVEVVAWNRSPDPAQKVAEKGAQIVDSVDQLTAVLPKPRLIWVMLPAGEITTTMINKLASIVEAGDTIVDGANSFYKNSQALGLKLAAKGIHFIDVGVSGGPGGARHGACLMVGGSTEAYRQWQALFEKIAAPEALQFFEGPGAGHFVKMVHNGIEYGMMQAIGEGFHVLKASEYNLDLEKVADIYNHQSVIESRLIDWAKKGFAAEGNDLEEISGVVAHSGEGQWTVETAKELNIPVPVIEASFQFRLQSATNPSFTGQVVSMLRNQFGGHEVKTKK